MAQPITSLLLGVLIALLSSAGTIQAQGDPSAEMYSSTPASPGGPPPSMPLAQPRLLKLTGHIGYAFGGSLSGGGGGAELEGGPTVGALLSYRVISGGRVFLGYTAQNNHIDLHGTALGSEDYDLSLHELQFGGSLDMPLYPTQGRVWPHFAFSIGATEWAPEDPRYSDSWTFSWIVEGGFTVWLVKFIGLTGLLRLHGHVMQSENAAICYGGCVYLRDTTLMVEGEVGGGVTLAL